ncbi:DUF1565 domain-containing protein, partial [Rhizobium johnstonii]|uniref:DUF1565 domain-containing protein n=1 Tax=Rhizobium johnstonii TaxID=3019933 RepID=UPI003F952886
LDVDEDEQPAVLTAGTDRGRTVEAGSRDPGDASYAVPAGALFVATDGDDTADGSLENPFRTIGAAIAAAKPGGTIVVRAGDYHESV